MSVVATWESGSVTLQILAADESTWLTAATEVRRLMTVPGVGPITPSISQTRRSLQDQSQLRPLVRSIPSDLRRRSTSASTTRPVQHNVPSQLSIVARPHQAGLIRSWRADSLCPCLARSRNYSMLQNYFRAHNAKY